jgi:hypothetical protein
MKTRLFQKILKFRPYRPALLLGGLAGGYMRIVGDVFQDFPTDA